MSKNTKNRTVYKIIRTKNKKQIPIYCEELDKPVLAEISLDREKNIGIIDFKGIKKIEKKFFENGTSNSIKCISVNSEILNDELIEILNKEGYKIVNGGSISKECIQSDKGSKKAKNS